MSIISSTGVRAACNGSTPGWSACCRIWLLVISSNWRDQIEEKWVKNSTHPLPWIKSWTSELSRELCSFSGTTWNLGKKEKKSSAETNIVCYITNLGLEKFYTCRLHKTRNTVALEYWLVKFLIVNVGCENWDKSKLKIRYVLYHI